MGLTELTLTDDSIPGDIDGLSSLERLILSRNNFIHLSTREFANLSKLRYFESENCPQLQYVPLISPHMLVLYVTDLDAKEANLLDPQKIWKIFESSNKELFLSHVCLWYVLQEIEIMCALSTFPFFFFIPSRKTKHLSQSETYKTIERNSFSFKVKLILFFV